VCTASTNACQSNETSAAHCTFAFCGKIVSFKALLKTPMQVAWAFVVRKGGLNMKAINGTVVTIKESKLTV